ncbi:MAG: DUF2480 family protein [Bacteroidetes bacterium]|nr:DUF2480 family protein [Bacteroidota bacterium]
MDITNKVSTSALVTIDLEEFYPAGERVLLDIKDQLYQGLMLREKEFREFIKTSDWSTYQNKYVAIHCSADAIIPTWAFMLVASALEPFAKNYVFGNLEQLETVLYHDLLSKLDLKPYKDARIVIKGCGKLPVPTAAYVEMMRLLRPIAKSIMYGEPCSTVPLYKQVK